MKNRRLSISELSNQISVGLRSELRRLGFYDFLGDYEEYARSLTQVGKGNHGVRQPQQARKSKLPAVPSGVRKLKPKYRAIVSR
jgi:hypothetical protein